MKTRNYSIKKNEMAFVVVLSLLFAQLTAAAQESVFLDPAEATIIGTPGSWAASKGDTTVNDSLPALFDDDYTTYFNVVKVYKDVAWAGLDFGENNNKAISKFSFILRNDQMSTEGRLNLWKTRFTGAKIYGANSMTVVDNQVVDADNVGDLLYTISDADIAHITDSINIREYTDVLLDEPNMDGYRYVLIFFPSGSFGNLADIKFYGFDAIINSITENGKEDIALRTFINPQDELNVHFTLKKSSDISIVVYNVNGAIVYQKAPQKMLANTYQHTIDASSFNQGMYFVKLIVDQEQQVTQVIK